MPAVETYFFGATVDEHHDALRVIAEGVMFEEGERVALDVYRSDAVDVESLPYGFYILTTADLQGDGFRREPELLSGEEWRPVNFATLTGNVIDSGYVSTREQLFIKTGKYGTEERLYLIEPRLGTAKWIPWIGTAKGVVGERVVFFCRGATVKVVNMEGVNLWECRFRQDDPVVSSSIFVFGNQLVVLHLDESRVKVMATSYDIDSGAERWEYILPVELNTLWRGDKLRIRAARAGDRLCICAGRRMIAVDAKTGQVLTLFDADLEADVKIASLIFDGSYYYAIDTDCRRIQAYDPRTHKKKCEWQFNEAYEPNEYTRLETFGGKNYFYLNSASLANSAVYGALFVWTPGEVESCASIDYDPRWPDTEIMPFKEDKKDAYRVKLRTNDIHDLLRYGEIQIRMVAATFGKQLWETDTINKRFNGHIELVVDPAVGVSNARYLDALVTRCESFGRLNDVRSGTGREPITVTWRFDGE